MRTSKFMIILLLMFSVVALLATTQNPSNVEAASKINSSQSILPTISISNVKFFDWSWLAKLLPTVSNQYTSSTQRLMMPIQYQQNASPQELVGDPSQGPRSPVSYLSSSYGPNVPQVNWSNVGNIVAQDNIYATATSTSHFECPDGWPGTCGTSTAGSGSETNAITTLYLLKVTVPSSQQPSSWRISNIYINSNTASSTTWYVGTYTGSGTKVSQVGPFTTTATGIASFTVNIDMTAGANYWLAMARSLTGTPTLTSGSGTDCRYIYTMAAYNSTWPSSLTPSCTDTAFLNYEVALVTYNWSYGIYAYNYGFTVPSNAIVTGVEAKIYKYSLYNAGQDYGLDEYAQLLVSGAPTGTNQPNGGSWSTSNTFVTYGGPSNSWGMNITPAIVNGSTFGFFFQALINSGSANYTNTVYVDWVGITVYYTICTYSNLIDGQPAFSQTQLNWAGMYTNGNRSPILSGTTIVGNMACLAERSTISDGKNFWGVLYQDSSRNLKLTYNYDNQANPASVSATIQVLAVASYDSYEPFWSTSNTVVSGATTYFNVVTYGFTSTVPTTIQITSLTLTYSSNIPTVSVGSNYSAALTNSGTNSFHGVLRSFIELSGYVWVTASTSPSSSSTYQIEYFRTAAQNYTGSGIATYQYVNTNASTPVDAFLAQTSTTLYAEVGQTTYQVAINYIPQTYRVYTSLTSPFYTGPSVMDSPPQVGADSGLNIFYFSYLNGALVGSGLGITFWAYSEATGNFYGDSYQNPPINDNTANLVLRENISGNNSGIYVITVLVSNQQMFYYYTLDGGLSFKGPFTLYNVSISGNSYLAENIGAVPVLTNITETSLGKIELFVQVNGSPGLIMLTIGNFIPYYEQFTGTSSLTALQQTTTTNIISATTTRADNAVVSTTTNIIQNYVTIDAPMVSLFIAAVMILLPTIYVLAINRTIAGLLTGLIIGAMLGVAANVLPSYVLILCVGLLVVAVIFRPKGA